MKIKKHYLILAYVLLISISISSQERIGLSVYQDARLLFLGDDKGNSPATLNIMAQFKMQGNQNKWGYMIVYPEFEYSDLKGGIYKRYSVNIGYVLNKLILDNFEIGSGLGWGWIDRKGSSFSSSLQGNIAYKINNNLKVSLVSQLVQRSDLEIVVIRYSGFAGIEINF